MVKKSLDIMIAQMCVYILLLTLIQHTSFTMAGLERRCNHMSRPHPQGLCSSNLNRMLDSLCTFISNGGGNFLVKRSAERSEIDDSMREIILDKKDAFSYLTKREEGHQNIVCECCHNQCSTMELAQYCRLPSIRRLRSLDQNQANLITN